MMNKKGFGVLRGLVIMGIVLFGAYKVPTLMIQNQMDAETVTIQEMEDKISVAELGACNLRLDKYSGRIGDEVTGIFSDGGHLNCSLFVRYNSGDWNDLGVIVTEGGEASKTQKLTFPGEYSFVAICNDGACITPSVEIQVGVN